MAKLACERFRRCRAERGNRDGAHPTHRGGRHDLNFSRVRSGVVFTAVAMSGGFPHFGRGAACKLMVGQK